MSRGSTLKRIVARQRGFRLSTTAEKLNVAKKTLLAIAKGNCQPGEAERLASATLIVLGE